MFLRTSLYVTLLTVSILFCTNGVAQEVNDSLPSVFADSAMAVEDTISNAPKEEKSIIDQPVYYSSDDSMRIVMSDQKVFLYGGGKIKYQTFEIEADYVESDIESKEIYATGVSDTSNHYTGKPIILIDEEKFETDSVRYNIESSKGLIYNVVSEQGEGYLHSDLTKRNEQGHIHVQGGKYTTCDAAHPHFYMELTKAIVIPDDKIISGPAYLVIEDIPIPFFGLPFGFFPNSRQRGAGVLIPTYTDEETRGFGLVDGGWYQPFGQYLDMKLQGDIYTKGSWALDWASSYKVRYKFNGSMSLSYAINDNNDVTDYDVRKDFKWAWYHSKDPKANPTQSLSANVNFTSSGYNTSNSDNINDYLTSQSTSSVSFSKNWPGTPFNMAISANARQNLSDSTVSIDLPTGSFSASSIYPFRSKSGTGSYKWYENIGLSYSSKFASEIDEVQDTLLFESSTWRNMDAGFSHSIPLLINLKTDKIKMLTISPSLNYEGRLYNYYIQKRLEGDLESAEIETDTIRAVTYAHAVNPTMGLSLAPKVYGMFVNTKADANVIAVRHVMSPKATFSYTPDMSFINPNYYDTIYYMDDGELESTEYSYYENNMYGTPSSAGENGSIGLSLGNTLEMKVKPKNDSTGEAEPLMVSLIRSLSVSTNYYPFKDEFKWNDVSLSGSTSLLKNKLSINVNSKFSPYAIDDEGDEVDEFYLNNYTRFLRFTSFGITSSLSLKSKQGGDDKEDQAPPQDDAFNDRPNGFGDPMGNQNEYGSTFGAAGAYVDFKVPWSLNINYSYNLYRSGLKEDQTQSQTLRLSGDFSLTDKWKIGFNTGYDLEDREVTTTNFNVYRDLHCWEMTFSMVPFGTAESYSFTIKAKASLLSDLKYDKKEVWYDNF